MILVEENGIGILVGHLCYVLQHILFGNDSKQSPIVRNQALAQAQLAEDIHHDLHGCQVGHSEGAEVAKQRRRRRRQE